MKWHEWLIIVFLFGALCGIMRIGYLSQDRRIDYLIARADSVDNVFVVHAFFPQDGDIILARLDSLEARIEKFKITDDGSVRLLVLDTLAQSRINDEMLRMNNLYVNDMRIWDLCREMAHDLDSLCGRSK